MKLARCALFLCVLSAGASGCGEGGGAGGDGNGSAGVFFSESNAEDLAAVTVSALQVFPRLSGAYFAIVDAVPAQNPQPLANRSKALIEVGDIGLCASGQSNLTWDDADDDQLLSPGDAAALELVNCDDELMGTVTLSFERVEYASTIAQVQLDVAIDDSADAPPVALTGLFRVEVNGTPGPPESAIVRYWVAEQSDPQAQITASVEGETEYRIGCFNLQWTLDLEQGSFSLLQPFAVFSVPGYGIMTMEAFGRPPLVFESGGYPASGDFTLLAQSGATPCAALEIGADGVDSNDSLLALTATGGGDVTLVGQTAAVAPFTVETSWDALRR